MRPKKNKQGQHRTPSSDDKGNTKSDVKVPDKDHGDQHNNGTTPSASLDEDHGANSERVKYSRRKVQSNWDRYDEGPVSTYESPKETKRTTQTYQELLSKSGAVTSSFQFKDERQWNEDNTNTSLVLDLDKLASALHSPEISQEDRLFMNEDGSYYVNQHGKENLDRMNGRSTVEMLSKTLCAATSSEEFLWDYGNFKIDGFHRKADDLASEKVVSRVEGAVESLQQESPSSESHSPLDDIDELLALSEQHTTTQSNSSSLRPGQDKRTDVATSQDTVSSLKHVEREACTDTSDTGKTASVVQPVDATRPTDKGQELEDWLDEILG